MVSYKAFSFIVIIIKWNSVVTYPVASIKLSFFTFQKWKNEWDDISNQLSENED